MEAAVLIKKCYFRTNLTFQFLWIFALRIIKKKSFEIKTFLIIKKYLRLSTKAIVLVSNLHGSALT